MKLTRRDFVKVGGSAALAVFGLSTTSFAFLKNTAIENHSSNSFRNLIGEKFSISGSEASAVAKLVKVQDFPYKTKGGECYSMMFEMPSDDFVQDTYEMFHPSIGKFELLSVPGKGENDSSLLISVINRL